MSKKKPKKRPAPKKHDGAKLARAAKKAEAVLAKKRKSLDEELALIRDRIDDIEDAFYDIAKALGRIDDKELWRAEPGCESTPALCEKLGLFSDETARKLLAIHKHRVSRRVAMELGIGASFQLTRYIQATPEADTVDGLVGENAIVGKKRVLLSSVGDLKDAADAAARSAGTRPRHESRAEDERSAEEAVRKVRRGMRDIGATGADVRAHMTRTSFEVIVKLTAAECDRIDV